MKKWKFRQVTATLLAAVMILGTAADVSAGNSAQSETFVQETSENGLMTGRLKTQFLELDLDEFKGAQYQASALVSEDTDTVLKASQVYSDEWDKYSTNYYYNMMDDAQREFWDALDVLCLSYLTKKTDLESYYGSSVTDYVYSTKLSEADAKMVTMIFQYSNPQYYFLEPMVYSSRNSLSSKIGVAMRVYSAFADGDDRAKATKKFETAIQSWLKVTENCSSDYEKVKAIHDQICTNTVYNYGALNPFGEVDVNGEEQQMTQSAYSTFCMGTTVCAGYAQACELMCNAVGIDAIVVTSADHEWNKVRIGDSWYNVDCTWDDDEQIGVSYTFFAKNDDAYENKLSMASSHRVESFWNKYLPKCTLDSGSTYLTAGTLPEITEETEPVTVTATPVYATTKLTNTQYVTAYKVTLNCETEGASIYYTLDGTTPSPAFGKSKKYKGTFKITEASQLKAIAVCDQKKDSGIVVDETFGAISYSVKYVLNGGENSEENPETYSSADGTIKLEKPTKTGYKFAGWYTDKNFTSDKVTKIKKGTTGKLTLYAKWTPISYTVKFDGNGATSGSVKSKTYKYGKSYKLPANKFKKKGYTFAGWSTKKNGKGTTYKNKKSIKNLTSKSGKTITLYAQWKKNK